MQLLQIVLVAVLAYMLGSVPTGLLVARLKGVDLMSEGSGKTGATNTLNAVGPAAAATVLAVDLVKGVLAVLLAYLFTWDETGWLAAAVTLAGAAVILGHNYSLGVRLLSGRWGGGRGIVPALGAMIMLHPFVAFAAVPVALLTIAVTRLMVIGALAGTIGAVVVAVILVAGGSLSAWFLPAVMLWAVLVTLGFRDNLQRLLRGAEPKLGLPR
ncbi:MAG: acyl phosphate:glycerol-3-phosphate acyltransferase [Chloroflexia bacterium]|nr:acyl phosphate:glycerol-3-phosphate acyltransferase [Chloroflexia bacterium]